MTSRSDLYPPMPPPPRKRKPTYPPPWARHIDESQFRPCNDEFMRAVAAAERFTARRKGTRCRGVE